jgi:hypothetical protein
MTEHQTANGEVRELASLFALGVLPPEENAAFKEHAAYRRLCAEEARGFRDAASWMLFASDGPAAPPHLRERLPSRMRQPDYPCAMAFTNHRDSHTVDGCMVLIVAFQQNAMLPWTR